MAVGEGNLQGRPQQSCRLTGFVSSPELVLIGGGTELGNAMSSTSDLPIETLVEHALVLVARAATQRGARPSLAHVGELAFATLNRELQRQGVTTKVIADMLGMAPRTYHRRVEESRSLPPPRRTVSEQVLELVQREPAISAHQVKQALAHESPELICSVLRDLVHSRLIARSGWGDSASYRALGASDPVGEVAIGAQAG